MNATDYLLNLVILAYVLLANLGTHEMTRRRRLAVIAIDVFVGLTFLTHMPLSGDDAGLEAAGLIVGVALGALAAALVRVRVDSHDGRPYSTAGTAFAVLWVVVIVGRMLFAYGSEHWFARGVAHFARAHQISGSGAFTGAFVLMALAMITVRLILNTATAHGLSTTRHQASRLEA